MHRRNLIKSLAASPLIWGGLTAQAQASTTQIIAEMKRRQKIGQNTSAAWVAQKVRKLPADQRLTAAYGIVQSVSYRVTRWTGDADSLFSLGRGDCRHKAYGQMRLFTMLGIRVRHVKIRFDWADLPIPQPILANLRTTLGMHDSVAVATENSWMIVDATWNPALSKLRFPVSVNWDGRSPTLPLTHGELVSAFADELPLNTSLYDYFSVPLPIRDRTQAFNRALNGWLNAQSKPDIA